MSEELSRQVADLARRLDALEGLGVRVDQLEIAIRRKDLRFSDQMSLILTAVVGAIMIVNAVITAVYLWIN